MGGRSGGGGCFGGGGRGRNTCLGLIVYIGVGVVETKRLNDFELMSRSLKRRRGGVICSPFPSHLRHTYVLPIGLGGLAPKAQTSPPAPTREGRLGGPFPSTPHALLSSLRPYIFHAHPGATASPRPGSVAQKHRRGKPAPAYVHCVLRKGSCQVSLLSHKEDLCTTHRQPYTSAWKAQRRARAPAPGTLVCSTNHRAFAPCTVLYLHPSIHTTHTCRKEKYVTIYPTLSRTTLNPSIQYRSIHSDTSNNVTSTPFNKAQTMNIQATTPFFVDNHQLHTHHS